MYWFAQVGKCEIGGRARQAIFLMPQSLAPPLRAAQYPKEEIAIQVPLAHCAAWSDCLPAKHDTRTAHPLPKAQPEKTEILRERKHPSQPQAVVMMGVFLVSMMSRPSYALYHIAQKANTAKTRKVIHIYKPCGAKTPEGQGRRRC